METSLSNKKILIIDDEEDILKLLSMVLKKEDLKTYIQLRMGKVDLRYLKELIRISFF
jgi:DNA-binding NtrC family response regulator